MRILVTDGMDKTAMAQLRDMGHEVVEQFYEPEELGGKTCIAITNLPPRPMMGIDSCGMLISAVHHENGEERLHLLMVDPHIPAGAKLY